MAPGTPNEFTCQPELKNGPLKWIVAGWCWKKEEGFSENVGAKLDGPFLIENYGTFYSGGEVQLGILKKKKLIILLHLIVQRPDDLCTI